MNILILLAAFLYIVGGVQYFIQGKYELAVVYVAYAVANFALARL